MGEKKSAGKGPTRVKKVSESEKYPNADFRALVEKGSDVILIIGKDLTISYASPSFSHVFGKDPKGFMGTPINEFFIEHVHPDDLKSMLEAYENCLEKPGNECRAEFRFKHSDGTWHHLVVVKMNHFDSPSVNGLAINIRDITEQKKTSEALRESEVRYRRLFEAAKDGILILDAGTGQIVDVNPFLTDLLGYTREEFFGKKVWDLGFFKDIAANEANFLELQEKGYVRYEDMPLETKDGRKINVEFVSNVYLIDRLKVVQCNIRDITQRKLHETEIANLNSFLLSVRNLNQKIIQAEDFDQLLADSCRILTEIRGYIDVSIAFVDAETGEMRPRANYGGHVKDSWRYSSECGGEAPSCIRKVMGDNLSTILEREHGICTDCGFCGHEEAHQSILVPMRNKSGELMGIISACLEMGRIIHPQEVPLFEEVAGDLAFAYEKLRGDRALAESEEKYHTLVETMQEGLWVIDENAKTTFVNPAMARMLGYTVDEMLGKPFFHFMDEQNVELAHSYLARRRMGISETHEFEFIRKDGNRLYVLLATSPIMGKGGEYRGAIAGVQDITERRRLVEELKLHNDTLLETANTISDELAQAHQNLLKQERLAILGQMAASVSHELRNPLSVINNVAYYLKNTIPEMDEKNRHMLDLLEREVDRSDRIIRNMLIFSSRKPIIREPMSFNILLQEYFEGTDRVPGNVDLELRLSQDTTVMSADSEKLNQVIDNLVSNACHAMPTGGKLTISTAIDGDSVVLLVEDTGHGIPQKILPRIFEPLFSTRTTGFGLGLAIVKGLVEDHDGKIEVESQEGKGTRFTVTIPRYRGE